MDTNQVYYYMEAVPYHLESQEPYGSSMVLQEDALLNEVFSCQTQESNSSPVSDYNHYPDSGGPMSSETLFWDDNSPQSQTSFHDLESNEELFDSIFKAHISNEQMDVMLQEIEFDDQLADFDSSFAPAPLSPSTFLSSPSLFSNCSDYSLSAPTSATSSPKRKYSSGSSSSCYSYDLSDASGGAQSPPPKKARKPRARLPDRKERKKEQNKKAAIKYREKKKNQQQQCNDDVADLESTHTRLAAELAALQNEMKVILPLAQAAFASNTHKRQQLQHLLGRIGTLL